MKITFDIEPDLEAIKTYWKEYPELAISDCIHAGKEVAHELKTECNHQPGVGRLLVREMVAVVDYQGLVKTFKHTRVNGKEVPI